MIIVTIICLPLSARHGSNIMAGTIMGAGLGGIFGGSDGVVPGLVTGMAVGTMAEMADHADCHPHHHHEVVYTHEVRPSYASLEFEIERLEEQLRDSNNYIRHLEHNLDQKNYAISKLEERISHLERELVYLKDEQKPKKTGFVIEAKAVSAQ